MRSRLEVGMAGLVFACANSACAEKEAMDPGAITRAETVDRIAPPSRATSLTVRCACDADGDLHVSAPPGSRVTVPEDATRPAEAQIVLPEDEAALPIRRVRSLGFVGDGKLTESTPRGGPWNAPDALLPAHRHVEPTYAPTIFGYYASRPYAHPHAAAPSPVWSTTPSPSMAQPSWTPSRGPTRPARAPRVWR